MHVCILFRVWCCNVGIRTAGAEPDRPDAGAGAGAITGRGDDRVRSVCGCSNSAGRRQPNCAFAWKRGAAAKTISPRCSKFVSGKSTTRWQCIIGRRGIIFLDELLPSPSKYYPGPGVSRQREPGFAGDTESKEKHGRGARYSRGRRTNERPVKNEEERRKTKVKVSGVVTVGTSVLEIKKILR